MKVFTDAKNELRELIRLVAEIENYDTTLAKQPEIVPTPEAMFARKRKEQRKNELLLKYELV
ncbi:hypothetical protein LMG19282_01506 [Cupriavidus campinensis]|uniref:Uncharacterized protein n=1 Tax=Cupriavidus campinensis TaxID=151783 RepID=A0ABY3EJ64_9BURK|nr:hypothetical protein [Cupriavidus campinensis]TSP10966.1 hypothetical protein FGG12_19065 [Cupriavidus campinensis]CAG2138504.1 hypothetical protein LMG19282_01506 [Cupriavidus campinensis]